MVDSWETLWKTDGHGMKKAGVPVRDRKSVLTGFSRLSIY